VDAVGDEARLGPHERAAEREAVRQLHAILDELDDEKRAVFVLAELEQMTVPEIAEAVEANLNTVYSRLRAARREFEQAVARHRARDEWRDR
jgi:RNA polymerase sigma-70 factor (ECF subfamily)